MIQSYINSATPLVANDSSVQFQSDCIRTRNCNNWLCHNSGSANYEIVEGGIYEINFSASISSATAGVIAFQLYNNGEAIPGTLMAVTLPTADAYEDISCSKLIRVCCKGNSTISVRSVNSVVTPSTPTTSITTQIPIIISANLDIDRISC